MNDRFKCRAWNKKKLCYFYWDITMGFRGSSDLWEDPEQCTGLKDKNGKLIYEGDILKASADVYRVVQWDDDGFAIKSLMGFFLYPAEWSAHEVIGNIHENPDLL